MNNSICYAQKVSSHPLLEYGENVNRLLQLLMYWAGDCQHNGQIRGISENKGRDKNTGEGIVLM
jgi:hypothetical protein